MAEQSHSGSVELGAPMDYAEHERTYSSFIVWTKLGILASLIAVVSLALFAFGGGSGFWLGTLLLFLMFGALAVGLMGKGSATPLGVVLVIGLVLVALTAG